MKLTPEQRQAIKDRADRAAPQHIFDLEFYRAHVTPEAKGWVEEQFPEEHYGEDILVYEAWGMRALLEMAFMAGASSARQDVPALLACIEALERENVTLYENIMASDKSAYQYGAERDALRLEIEALRAQVEDLERQKEAAVVFGDEFKKAWDELRAENSLLCSENSTLLENHRECIAQGRNTIIYYLKENARLQAENQELLAEVTRYRKEARLPRHCAKHIVEFGPAVKESLLDPVHCEACVREVAQLKQEIEDLKPPKRGVLVPSARLKEMQAELHALRAENVSVKKVAFANQNAALSVGEENERLRAAAQALRAAQRAYLANRGNETLGKAVGEAAKKLDEVLEFGRVPEKDQK
jgi:uncharacterized coiled-coil DUF342 family protein